MFGFIIAGIGLLVLGCGGAFICLSCVYNLLIGIHQHWISRQTNNELNINNNINNDNNIELNISDTNSNSTINSYGDCVPLNMNTNNNNKININNNELISK